MRKMSICGYFFDPQKHPQIDILRICGLILYGVEDAVLDEEYFDKVIDFGQLLAVRFFH